MLALILAALCVVANAFFVAAEFAFAKVRPTSLDALGRAGDAKAALAYQMTKRLDAYLSATQLGITLASLGLGWLGKPALAQLIEPPMRALGASEALIDGVATTGAFTTISLLHIILGELVPKSAAIQYPETVARWTGRVLRYFFLLTWPAMWVLNGLSNLTLRLLRLPPMEHAEGKLSAEEIRLIINASFGDSSAEDRKRDLLERVLKGTDHPVRSIMVPRVDIVTVAPTDDLDHCLELVRTHGYSRYPVCKEGNPDEVLGYVHIKDLLTAAGARRNGSGQSNAPLSEIRVEALRRDVLFIPENTRVGELLTEFQATHIPIAIVVDEYGGTDGLVTVEDVVEEMVGEIQDEHDAERPRIVTRDDGTIVVNGSVPLHELELPGLTIEEDEEPDTVGGYVVDRLGRLARPGDRVQWGPFDLVVEDVRRRRVARVAFERRAPLEAPEAGDES
ncbi:MAG: hemolysin family protein [Myxococcota bacterium]